MSRTKLESVSRDVVLKALQLSMVLVPPQIREELKCLLNFMRVAAEPDAVELSVKVAVLIRDVGKA